MCTQVEFVFAYGLRLVLFPWCCSHIELVSELFTREVRACARQLRGLGKHCRYVQTECAPAFHFSFRKRSGESELFFYP